jgi:hypothetical protein
MKKVIYLAAILLVVASISCKKDNAAATTTTTTNNTNNTNNNNNNTVTANSTPQVTVTINDTNYSMVTGTVYSGGSSSSGGHGGPTSYGSDIANTSLNQPNIGISKGSLVFSSLYADTGTFDAFFNTGTYTYSSNFNTTNGIQIEWCNSKGDIYTTSQGSGNQTGSTFTITAKHALGYSINGSYYVRVMAKFNCTLYSTSGASIQLTNGVYVGDFGDF